MLFFSLYLGALLLPGFFLLRIFSCRQNVYLLSASLSCCFMVGVVAISRGTGLDVSTTQTVFLSVLFVLFFAAAARFIADRKTKPASSVYTNNYSKLTAELAGAGVVVVLLCIYELVVGVYDELPADRFRHLEYSKLALADLADGEFQPLRPLASLAGKLGFYWYYIQAFFVDIAGLDLVDALWWTELANNLILLLAIYFFALTLFANQPAAFRVSAAVACAILFAMHFGTITFAYIRYYSYAPTMLALVIYFTAMTLLTDVVRQGFANVSFLILIPVLTVTAAVLHTQEALFILIMTVLVLTYAWVARGHVLQSEQVNKAGTISQRLSARLSDTRVLALVAISIVVALFFYSYFNLNRWHGGIDNKLVLLNHYLPLPRLLYILNPGYQFYITITFWGIVVYALFVLNFRRFKDNAFIVAGMLSPLLTVFNPLFVDMFLRHSRHINLWRMSFLVPLIFVGGFLLIYFSRKLARESGVHKLWGAAGIVLIVALLFPVNLPFLQAHYSRVPGLAPVSEGNSPRLWQDMLDYLDSIENTRYVLTDPVTGYALTALTHHHSPRDKFYLRYYEEFNFENYSDKPLQKYAGWLIVVNNRDGAPSYAGKMSGHWPEENMRISRYYSDALMPHLQSNPDRFKPLWNQNNIWIYEILK